MNEITSTDETCFVRDNTTINFTFTNAEEVTTVAKHLRDIRQNDELLIQVIEQIKKSQFYSRFVELYQNNHELQFRRDITFMVELTNSKTDVSRMLLKGGVLKLMIEECRVCTDKEIVVNMCKTLRSSAQKSNNNKLYQVKHGVLTLLPKLIDTWRNKDDEVLCAGLGLLVSSARSVDFKELLARDITDNDNNIPELLIIVMNESSNREVMVNVVNCVGNLISDTMVMCEYFTTKVFVDSSFRLILTDVLPGPFRYKLLRFVIYRLTSNNPKLMTSLLVKHVDFLRHLSLLNNIETSRMSTCAIDIVNKYFSCKESKHQCRLISRFGLFNILKFVLFYCLDVVLDIKVGINSIVGETSTVYEGCGLLLFSLISLFYINYQSLSRYYLSCFRSVDIDPCISLQGSSRGKFLKFLVPWKFDSFKHVVFNILTLLQLHPVIIAFEIALHSTQNMSTIISKKFRLARLNVQEKMLENVPCTLIKIIVLYKTISVQNELTRDNYLTLFSTFYGMMMLTLKLTNFEKLSRQADGECRTLSGFQTFLIFLGNLFALLPRVAVFIALYIISKDKAKMWIFVASICFHVFITILVHLLARHQRYDSFKLAATKSKFVTWDFMLREGDGEENVPLLRLIRFLLVLCLSWSEGFFVNLRHPIDYLSGDIPSTLHLRSPQYFFSLFTLNLLEIIAVTLLANVGDFETDKLWVKHLTYISVAAYFVSGLIFILHFTVCNPDRKGEPQAENVNPRLKHFGYTLQVGRRNLYCHVTPKKAMQVNGKKILLSTDYNHRLQVVKPCLYCVLKMTHPNIKSKARSENSFVENILRRFGRNSGDRDYATLDWEDEENSLIAEQFRYPNRTEMEWLVQRVGRYNSMHDDLLYYFPGIQRFEDTVDSSVIDAMRQHLQQQGCAIDEIGDDEIRVLIDNIPNRIGRGMVKKCKELNIFRGIGEIKDEELSPGVVENCTRVKDKILTHYSQVPQSEDDVSDSVFKEFQELCEEYFFLEEAIWEEKCMLWCKTAPTDVLVKHHARNGWESEKCKEEIIKWIESQGKEEVVDKHAKFHLNGIKYTAGKAEASHSLLIEDEASNI